MVFIPAPPPADDEPAEKVPPPPRPGEVTYRVGRTATYRGKTQEARDGAAHEH